MNKEETRNLAWWQIAHWVPAWPRAFATVAVISLVCAFLVEFLVGFAAHLHLLSAFRVKPLTALATVLGKALGFGFMFGAGLLLRPPSGRRSSPPPDGASSSPRDRLRWSRTDIFMILLLGLGVGFGFGIESGLVGGLVLSFVIGLGFVLGGGPPQRLGWLGWSRAETRPNLLTGLVVGLVAGLVVGFGYGLAHGLRFGLMYGVIVGIGYLLVIVVGGRLTQQLSQPRWSRTDIPTTLLIGLVIAIVSTGGYGIIYILVAILGERPPPQRSRPRWSRPTTPTTLATGLMAGLVLGLVLGLVYALTTGLKYGLGLRYGLSPGLALGVVFGLTVGLQLGLRQPPTEATSPLDPRSLWRREFRFGLILLGFEFVSGLMGGLVNGLVAGPGVGLVSGLMGGLVFGLGSGLVSSAAWEALLANAQLWRRDEAPARLLRFLDDARERQILRTVGPVYQFRDKRLQDRLAEVCETRPGNAPDTHVDHPSLSA